MGENILEQEYDFETVIARLAQELHTLENSNLADVSKRRISELKQRILRLRLQQEDNTRQRQRQQADLDSVDDGLPTGVVSTIAQELAHSYDTYVSDTTDSSDTIDSGPSFEDTAFGGGESGGGGADSGF